MSDNRPYNKLVARDTAAKGEVLKRLEFTIRPESPISTTWRLYCDDPPREMQALKGAPLSQKGRVFGGSKQQAIQDALFLEAQGDFFFIRPPDLQLPPGTTIL